MDRSSQLSVSRPIHRDTVQTTLGSQFDKAIGSKKIESMGEGRFRIGEFTEELAARLLGCQRHYVDTRCKYCPDISFETPSACNNQGRQYYEVKAIGRSKQLFIYKGRFEKDVTFFKQSGKAFAYVLVHHTTKVTRPNTLTNLRNSWLQELQWLKIVPFRVLLDVTQDMEPEKLNSKYGGSQDRPEYGSGYRIGFNKLPLEDLQTIHLKNVAPLFRLF